MGATLKSAITVTVIILTGMYARAWYESSAQLSSGREQRALQRIEESIHSFRRSVSWTAPLLPYPDEALRELLAIAHDDAVPGETRSLALEEAKRGLSASKSFMDGVTGRRAKLEQINAELRAPDNGSANSGVREVHTPRVKHSMQILAQISFFGWIGAVLAGIWRGFDPRGAVSKQPLLYALSCWAVFFGIWLVALRLA